MATSWNDNEGLYLAGFTIPVHACPSKAFDLLMLNVSVQLTDQKTASKSLEDPDW